MALTNCVCIAQAKGGVGKTTIATNIAGVWASQGKRVLLVDFDPQGNCALDLGYEPNDGKALFTALVAETPTPVLRDVRPGLDVIPSGPALSRFPAAVPQDGSAIQTMGAALERVIGEAGEYDAIVIDTPPGDVVSGQAAMLVSSIVLAPSRSDDASLMGTYQLAQRFAHVLGLNPSVRFGGVVLFDIGAGATRIAQRIRGELATMLGSAAPVLVTQVRSADAAAVYARSNGMLAEEIAETAPEAARERFSALREGRATESVPSNAPQLADDFRALADEIYVNMTRRVA